MKTKDFVSALSRIDEKYVQAMLEDPAAAETPVTAQDTAAQPESDAGQQQKAIVQSVQNHEQEQLALRAGLLHVVREHRAEGLLPYRMEMRFFHVRILILVPVRLFR